MSDVAWDRYLAWEPTILNRAAEHGCLGEDVETGDPVVCGACCAPTRLPEEPRC